MTQEFLDSYGSTRWQEKKNKILTRDNYTCAICGKHGNEHTLMHVHHLTYKNCKDGKAWNCPDEDLVTLCEDCHEKVHSGFPFKDKTRNLYYYSNLSSFSNVPNLSDLASTEVIAFIGCKNQEGKFINGCNILISDAFCENHEHMGYTFASGLLRYDMTWVDGDSYGYFSISKDFTILHDRLLLKWFRLLIAEVNKNAPTEDTNSHRVLRCLNQQSSFDFITAFYCLFSTLLGYDNRHLPFDTDPEVNSLMSTVFSSEWIAFLRKFKMENKNIDNDYLFNKLFDK